MLQWIKIFFLGHTLTRRTPTGYCRMYYAPATKVYVIVRNGLLPGGALNFADGSYTRITKYKDALNFWNKDVNY